MAGLQKQTRPAKLPIWCCLCSWCPYTSNVTYTMLASQPQAQGPYAVPRLPKSLIPAALPNHNLRNLVCILITVLITENILRQTSWIVAVDWGCVTAAHTHTNGRKALFVWVLIKTHTNTLKRFYACGHLELFIHSNFYWVSIYNGPGTVLNTGDKQRTRYRRFLFSWSL